VLRVVMLGLPLISATYLGNRLVLALGRDHLFMRVSLVALVVNVGVNLGLVPVWGVQGAGAALVISLLSAWLVYRNILIREGLRLPMVRELSRALTLTLVSWGLTVFILGKVKPSWDLDWSGIHTASLPALAVTALMVLAFYLGLVRVVGLKPGPIRS
jgi:Na+-driven multidrug efflux pump